MSEHGQGITCYMVGVHKFTGPNVRPNPPWHGFLFQSRWPALTHFDITRTSTYAPLLQWTQTLAQENFARRKAAATSKPSSRRQYLHAQHTCHNMPS